jgi:hypothetical protein
MMNDRRKISIDVHLDSVSEVIGFSKVLDDPSYFTVMDRFLKIADQRGFKLSLFLIGRELEDAKKFAQVGQWQKLGHEIGNHSYNHHVDLSRFDAASCHEEVHRAHQIIEAACGVPPVGFISPGWGGSHNLWTSLAKLGYSYDTSLFPSWLMLPQYLFWITRFFGNPRHGRFLRRGWDVHRHLLASREAVSFNGGNNTNLHILPIPTTRHRIACWHSLAFYLGWDRYERLLRSALRSTPVFHYVMHVGDLLSSEDLGNPGQGHYMPRVDSSVREKEALFNRVLDIFESEGKEITTTKKLVAEAFAAKET